MQMKKSMLAMLCVLFGLFAVPLAYADEMTASDDATTSQDEPLPPLIDPAATPDSGNWFIVKEKTQ